MSVKNDNTAETETEETKNGNETITIHTSLGDEDEDVHKCGRCQAEFSTLDAFIQHKLHKNCKTDGRYLCGVCEKTFKTLNILRTHLKTHTDEKNFKCELCNTSFRTKGSLIRHNRRHTERPYRCNLCGQSFRESGALTRHLKSLTPCTEKIRFVQYKEILVSKDGARKAAAAAGDSLICQAIINSGIALETEETVVEETSEEPEGITKVISVCPETAENITEIHDGEVNKSKLHKCPHCDRTFKGINYLRFHVKGHLYKPFKCTICQKDFLSGYLLKKHMEVHVSERRYKCGECGKLYKTIGHVREHMRAHSDERPYHCNKCDRGYKTKNALQVHQRTHGDEKPFVCQYCTRSFREKGSLVRHIRHHTGEKPYKCPKCGRGFAEHGTLNRHMRAKTAALISEDPHAVLVEFSSVVADTQEYIIKTQNDEVQGEQIAVIQDDQSEVGSHIMKVVQQIVSQSHGAGTGSPQIIVRNAGANEEGLSISDCGDTITIATPESLTEQVAMTLASAINDGTLLGTTGTVETPEGTVTVVTTQQDIEEGVQMVQQQQQEEYVLTPEVEIQT
uniref:Transcription factor E4F1 n=1 Tax=Periophthalmus magnuspinnatus TaxID=409849 RepID=A0A3B4BA96_9GOBI